MYEWFEFLVCEVGCVVFGGVCTSCPHVVVVCVDGYSLAFAASEMLESFLVKLAGCDAVDANGFGQRGLG